MIQLTVGIAYFLLFLVTLPTSAIYLGTHLMGQSFDIEQAIGVTALVFGASMIACTGFRLGNALLDDPS